MTHEDFWSRLASFVSGGSVVVDRPKGSAHPSIPGLIYPLDYGYLTDLRSGDGEGVDVWIGSLKPQVITGVICTLDLGKRDTEVKILLGCTRAEQRRILSLHNYGNQRAVLVRAEAVRRAPARRRRARGTARGQDRSSRMKGVFWFAEAVRRDPTIDVWLNEQASELGALARTWFQRMRECGRDVREVMHDGCPTACVEGAAFGYVNVFRAHANVGFFHGAELEDPAGLLEGTGKRMRHVKVKPGVEIDSAALAALISAAYTDMKLRLAAEH